MIVRVTSSRPAWECRILQMLLRDNPATPPVRIEVDLRHPPSVVRPQHHPGLPHPLSLDWDRAVDDHQHLRRCPVCGCEDLYARKAVPHVTGFLLVILAALVAMVLFGFGQVVLATVAMVSVLALDVLILLIARRFLVCYRCGTQFRKLAVPRHHGRWEATTAERHRPHRVKPLEDQPSTPPAGEEPDA